MQIWGLLKLLWKKILLWLSSVWKYISVVLLYDVLLLFQVISLSAAVAYEGVPLHMPYFAKLWYEIYQLEHVEKKYIDMLCRNSSFIDYVDAVLLDERQTLCNQHIYIFFCNYFPRVSIDDICPFNLLSLHVQLSCCLSAWNNIRNKTFLWILRIILVKCRAICMTMILFNHLILLEKKRLKNVSFKYISFRGARVARFPKLFEL